MNINIYIFLAIGICRTGFQQSSAQEFVVCGPMLAKFREEICYSEKDKRGPMLQTMEEETDSWPLTERLSALEWFRRKRSGLADECCTKPCSKDEIKNYC